MRVSTKRLVIAALLTGLTLLLGLSPLGIISIPPANVTLMVIPVIIGTLVQGLTMGLIQGFVFGCCSAYKALFVAPSALALNIIAVSPLVMVAISVLARVIIPLTTYAVYRLLYRRTRPTVAIAVAAVTGTLTNTVCYLGGCMLAYLWIGLDPTVYLGTVLLLNVPLEMVACVVACVPIVQALHRMPGGSLAKMLPPPRDTQE